MNVNQPAPPISVLMSCYNGSRWLPGAIDSVLAQTFKDFEFILVDDGSRDSTLEIIKAYAAKDQRIKVLAKANSGLADSLNAGLAIARGTWVARVDQDDICVPARLERQLSSVAGSPGLVLLGTGFTEINEAGAVLQRHCYPSSHSVLSARLERLQGFFPHSSAFYCADAVRAVGGYNRRFTRAEDRRLWLALSLYGQISSLPEALVMIRKHPGQMSLDSGGARQLCDSVASSVCHFLQKAGKPDPAASVDEADWRDFLNWVDSEVEKSGLLQQRRAWWAARERFISAPSRPAGLATFALSLLFSGHAFPALYMKFCGSSLPRRLAAEWQPAAAAAARRPK